MSTTDSLVSSLKVLEIIKQVEASGGRVLYNDGDSVMFTFDPVKKYVIVEQSDFKEMLDYTSFEDKVDHDDFMGGLRDVGYCLDRYANQLDTPVEPMYRHK